jgi:hypothetical protein
MKSGRKQKLSKIIRVENRCLCGVSSSSFSVSVTFSKSNLYLWSKHSGNNFSQIIQQ